MLEALTGKYQPLELHLPNSAEYKVPVLTKMTSWSYNPLSYFMITVYALIINFIKNGQTRQCRFCDLRK